MDDSELPAWMRRKKPAKTSAPGSSTTKRGVSSGGGGGGVSSSAPSASRRPRDFQSAFGTSEDADRASRARDVDAIHRRTQDALRSALRTARETEDIGLATHEELARQRGVIERSHDKVRDIDHMNKTSSWLLRGMSGFTGRIRNMFSKPPSPPPKSTTTRRASAVAASAPRSTSSAQRRRRRASTGVVTSSSASSSSSAAAASRGGAGAPPNWAVEGARREAAEAAGRGGRRGGGGGEEARAALFARADGGSGSGGIDGSGSAVDAARRNGGGLALHEAHKEVESELLDELETSIDRLMHVARATGEELDDHNRMLEALGEDVDRVNDDMRKNRNKARRLCD